MLPPSDSEEEENGMDSVARYNPNRPSAVYEMSSDDDDEEEEEEEEEEAEAHSDGDNGVVERHCESDTNVLEDGT